MNAVETKHSRPSTQLLTFTLGDEAFAIDILKVQEIKSSVTITPLPNAAPELRGVINLRGSVVPIVDLRRRLQMKDTEFTRHSVVIVTRVFDKIVGLVADTVSDVLAISPDQVSAPPQLESNGAHTNYLAGLVRVGERLLVLLDIDRALGEFVSREEPGRVAAHS
jgi:purine-binding chemotaxis protein CheW